MPKVHSARAVSASQTAIPLSTSKPKFDRSFHYDLKIREPFACEISKQDAKILFGDLGEYEAPQFKKFEVLCQPGAKIEFGTACAVHCGGSGFLIGVVETRRPDRSKTYRIHLLRNGKLSDQTIKLRDRVFPIVAIGGFCSP